jgi:hypothetical protein
LKKNEGRRRALAKLKAMLSGARFEYAKLDNPPLALWACLDWHTPDVAQLPEPEAVPMTLQQSCAVIDYLAVGLFENNDVLSTGMWSLVITQHALGRLIQRAPRADVTAALFEAHNAALNAPIPTDGNEMLLPAGEGVFVETLIPHRLDPDAPDQDLDALWAHIHLWTWLHADQLRDDQRPVGCGAPGARLGDFLLLPPPVRVVLGRPAKRH